MARRFVVLDVFTDRALSGNPLAVVLDADGLDGNQMQAVAREFNLSETVFVTKPLDEDNRARLRIFTVNHELPFAGHPTVGAAVLLAIRDGVETSTDFVLEEGVGPVSCHVNIKGERFGNATFSVPRMPEILEDEGTISVEACAQALGLDKSDIGFDDYIPVVATAGVPFVCVPLASRSALARISPSAGKLIGTSAARRTRSTCSVATRTARAISGPACSPPIWASTKTPRPARRRPRSRPC